MIKTFELQPGVILRCCQDTRFKMNCLSVQLVRPACRQEAAANALIPAVLLRGTQSCPDLRDITLRLDDLYGASVGALVRRVGDYQTTGLACGFTEDRFALNGDAILEPMADFLQELLLQPRLEQGIFCKEYVESEKRNLLAAIEARKNDKRLYAAGQLTKFMCAADPVGIPRLGEPEDVAALEPEGLYHHYEKILRESTVELFYVGAQEPERICQLLFRLFENTPRQHCPLPPQTPFRDGGKTRNEEFFDVTQAKLQMGFLSPATIKTTDFAVMQVLCSVFGSSSISKLFMNVREKMSLCYDIGSSYQGTKGILTVGAGMDQDQVETVEQEVMNQLEECRRGNISALELEAARQSLLSSLRSVHDSPGAIENYYATAALSGLGMSIQEYMDQVSQVDVSQLAQAAQSLQLHSVYTLKGVQ